MPAFFPFAKKLLERRAARALQRVAKQLASLEQGIFHHMRGIRVGAMDVPAIRPRPAYRPAQILPANFVRTAAHRAVKTKAAELCGALQNISQKIAAMQKPSELVVPYVPHALGSRCTVPQPMRHLSKVADVLVLKQLQKLRSRIVTFTTLLEEQVEQAAARRASSQGSEEEGALNMAE